MFGTISTVSNAVQAKLTTDKRQQPGQHAGTRITAAKPHGLSASGKRFLGDTATFQTGKPAVNRPERGGQIKTQAVLNPFAAVRNPVSEASFDELLNKLDPEAAKLKPSEKKKLLKQFVANANQLFTDVSTLEAQGKRVNVVKLSKTDDSPDKDKSTSTFPKLGDFIHLPRTERQKTGNFKKPNTVGERVDDALGAFAATVVLSMLFSPAVIIGGPIMKRADELEAAGKEQAKDGKFYLNALKQSPEDFNDAFEALQFSKKEKQALADTAKVYGLNVNRNNELRAYVGQLIDVLQAGANRLATDKDARITLQIMDRDARDYNPVQQDVTHYFTKNN